MKKLSKLEEMFLCQLKSEGLADEKIMRREYRFDNKRRWRFDFAWPDYFVAVEIEGGIWSNGRHTRGQGFSNDCEKHIAAIVLGWRVLRGTKDQLDNLSLLEATKNIIKAKKDIK